MSGFIKLMMFLSMLGFSSLSVAAETPLFLKVLNLNVAQHALQTGVSYIQDGTLISPDHINLDRPYCYSTGYRLQLRANGIYPVLETKVVETKKGVWQFSMKLDPMTGDSVSNFAIACYTKTETTLQDVRTGLNGVYEVEQIGALP